ncbi:YbbR-like domain-containing protein [Sporosarcina sp. HYO08]|uniref:CdaR family protein n=1 Tax=Sporosarcina sp. HYO08 TaxID=1759557 RepID=UPI0009E85457|nr:CdaR family protein [Sporosarcina sp. HYO08]
MDKLMDTPWFLRFTALALAIVVFISVKVEDGKTEGNRVGDHADIIRDVPVEVYYDNENLVVTGVPETVNMTIEGPANIVQTTKLLKDFTLKVDLRDLPMGNHSVRIQHENVSDKLQVRLDPTVIHIGIEEKITRTFRVDPELNERLLAEDYAVVKMDVDPATIEVTGAKSIIESISFVKASVTGEPGIERSFEQTATVRVLDRDLNKLNVAIVPEQVTIKVNIEAQKKEVPIVLKERGTPAKGVTIDSMRANEKTVVLSGSRKVLDELQELIVDVDVSKVDGSSTLTVDLKIPKGVSKMSLDKLKIDIQATVNEEELEVSATTDEAETVDEIAAEVTKEITNIPITVTGLDEKYKSSFEKMEDGFASVEVTAESDVIDALSTSDFHAFVDATGITSEGEKTLPISVEGPDDVRWKIVNEPVTIIIELV